MKFNSFAIAAVVAISTTSAQLVACDVAKLLPIANGDQSAQCAKDSGFSLVMAAVTETPPTPDQYPAICKSTACQGVLKQLHDAVPTDCALKSGKSLKSLTEPVLNSCKGPAPAPTTKAPAPGPGPAPVPAPTTKAPAPGPGPAPAPAPTTPQQKQC